MARYRKIDPRIWNDEKFRGLSNNGKLAFLFLLTHPHMTALGAMRATIAGLAEELGWELEAFREAFREALAKGMAEHDPSACLIALPNFLKYNEPESPNVVKSWVGSLDFLPECALKAVVIQRAKGFAEGLKKAFGEAFTEAFAKALPNQEQEQEQLEKKPPVSPKEKKTRTKESSVTFADWLVKIKASGEKAISDYKPVFEYAEAVGLPVEWIELAWLKFRQRYTTDQKAKRKRYTDWRQVFLNAVKDNWLKLWWFRDGQAGLTTVGQQAELEHRKAA